MLPTHHLLALVPNRVRAAVNRLHSALWYDFQPVRVEATPSGRPILSLAEAKKQKRTPVKPDTYWGKLYDQRWCRLTFPKSSQPLYLNWRDQGEATLYLNDTPYFGFDVAHRHCVLPAGATEGWIESTCVQSGIWHPDATGLDPRGSLFDGASVGHRNEDVWQAYNDLKCLFDLLLDERVRENPLLSPALNDIGLQAPVEKASPFYRRLLRLLDEAVDALDAGGPAAMRHQLKSVYSELRRDKTFQNCVLTGHAHIDLVWLWPERIGECKAVHVFSTVNHLMNLYPEFKFAYSQPASYEAVARRAPSLYRAVQKRIRNDQWQATGALYVESDTLIACGEALARSFVLGQDGFTAISGKPSRLTWLPDVFGYTGCLPQLMKLSGVDWFFTTKMTWNAINRFPYSSFVWRGIDGSEVAAHITHDGGYVTQMSIGDIKNALYGHQQADVHNEYLLPTGFGDGGGGPTDEMCERARRLGSLPGMPSLQWDHPENFFSRLDQIRDRLPVYQGECYLEYHRGTFTTHGNLKAQFRALERALQIHEAVLCTTGGTVPTAAWKRMVFSQFHDFIPGSSIYDVYAEGLPQLAAIEKEQLADAQAALEKKTGKSEPCVFNPLPVPVRQWVQTGATQSTYVELPPLTGLSVKQAEVSIPPATIEFKKRSLSNGLVHLTLNAAGAISRLDIGGKPVAIDEPLGSLVSYPDHPANFEPWDIDRQTLSLGQLWATPATIETRVDGPYRAALAVTRSVGRKSRATVLYRLEAGSPLVQVEIQLDWDEPETLLKMHFPTRYAAANARFGIPFGSILRPQLPSGKISEAMWEVPFSRYLAVFDEGERDGLFLVTESKYGATVRSGNIGLTLVRSPRFTGCDAYSRVWPETLTRIKPASPFADTGRHVIRFALGSYDIAAPRAEQPAVLADTLFTTPVVYNGKPVTTAYRGIDGGESLVPSWAKPDGRHAWVLRLHETGGRRGSARILLAKGWTATAVNLLGQPLLDKKIRQGRFDYSPYEIISLRLCRTFPTE